MTRVSTGSTTVPKALARLQLVHDEIAYVESDVRRLDRNVLAGVPDELGGELQTLRGRLWGTVNDLAYVHMAILRASGELDDSDLTLLAGYRSAEVIPDGAKRHGFMDALDDVADGIVDFSMRWGALGGAVGTWLAAGGSFSKIYQRQYDEMQQDTAPVRGVVTAGTEIALAVIFARAVQVAHYVEMPLDWRDRYDAASVHLSTKEAKTVSATAATAMREGMGSAIGGIKNKVAHATLDRLLQSTDAEQEAFARGVGDMLGATVDAQHGHPGSLDAVLKAVREGSYGTVLRDTLEADPMSLQDIIGAAGHVDAVTVPGEPEDRDRPAYSKPIA